MFAAIERSVAGRLFQLRLLRVRAFTFGCLTGFTARLAQGGLQFVLVTGLQGICLRLHGYDYSQSPFWAAIFVLSLKSASTQNSVAQRGRSLDAEQDPGDEGAADSESAV